MSFLKILFLIGLLGFCFQGFGQSDKIVLRDKSVIYCVVQGASQLYIEYVLDTTKKTTTSVLLISKIQMLYLESNDVARKLLADNPRLSGKILVKKPIPLSTPIAAAVVIEPATEQRSQRDTTKPTSSNIENSATMMLLLRHEADLKEMKAANYALQQKFAQMPTQNNDYLKQSMAKAGAKLRASGGYFWGGVFVGTIVSLIGISSRSDGAVVVGGLMSLGGIIGFVSSISSAGKVLESAGDYNDNSNYK